MLSYPKLLKTNLSRLPLAQIKKDLEKAIKTAKVEIKQLSTLPPDFAFVEALEKVLFPLDQALALPRATQNLYGSKSLDKLVEWGTNQSITLANSITQNSKLFKKIQQVTNEDLSPEELNLLKSWTNAFIFSGAGLTPARKKTLLAIDKQLNKLARLHENFINKDTYKKTLLVAFGDLAGIPQSVIEDAKKTPRGYLFNDTHLDDLICFAHKESVREQAYKTTKSVGKNPKVHKILLKINQLRQQKAQILGFTNYTELTLKQNLVKNTTELDKTVNQLAKELKPLVKQWFAEIKKYQTRSGLTPRDFNHAYTHNQLLDQRFNFNPQELKEFFPTKHVLKGLFSFLQDWTKLTFKKIPGFLPTFEVSQDREILGYLSLDLYARPHKNQGAWMDNLQPGGLGHKPWIVVASNFNPKDPLLSLDDLVTIFHEMGHALHGLLNDSFFPTQNGTGVSEEFVEFPSQFLENLIFTPKVLKLISRHQKTKKSMGPKEINLLKKYQHMGMAAQIYRQLYFQNLDQQFHRSKVTSTKSLLKLEQSLYKKMYDSLLSPQYSSLESFTHLTDNNYASNYYIYLWASLMEKDMFQTLGPQLKWKDIAPLYQTRGHGELETFEKLKGGKLNTKNFLRYYNLIR